MRTSSLFVAIGILFAGMVAFTGLASAQEQVPCNNGVCMTQNWVETYFGYRPTVVDIFSGNHPTAVANDVYCEIKSEIAPQYTPNICEQYVSKARWVKVILAKRQLWEVDNAELCASYDPEDEPEACTRYEE